MKSLQQIMNAVSRSFDDLLCWIFFPKEVCLVQGFGVGLLDEETRRLEEARRLRAAYNF